MRSAHSRSAAGRTPFVAALSAGCLALLLAGCTTGSGPGPTSSAPPSAGATGAPTHGPSQGPSAGSTGAESITPTAPASETAPGTTAPSTAANPPKTANVIIVHAGWDSTHQVVSVRAYAPGVLATSATCTLRLTRDGTTRTASRPASRSASDMQCGSLTVPGSQLSSGAWQVVVEFRSPEAQGTSSPQTIEVG